MKSILPAFGLAATAFLFSGLSQALEPGERVDNFRLLDQAGASHELYSLSDARAVVLMIYGNGCGIVQKSLPRLRQIRDEYRAKGVEFLLIDSNLQDDRDAVAMESTRFGNDLPILIDETQLIGEALGIERTGEVFVIDPRTWQLVYRGPMDDRLSYGTQKAEAKSQYLTDALDATLAGKQAPSSRRTHPAVSSISRNASDATLMRRFPTSNGLLRCSSKNASPAIAKAGSRPGR